jgi:hypothetical protein
MVPDDSQVGDWIAIFPGSNLPFVIRNTEQNKFQLVGHCYIHGAMDGEILLKMEYALGGYGITRDHLFKGIVLV